MILDSNSMNTASAANNTLILADGRDLSSIKFVGAIRNVDEQSTHIKYDIEDGTGLITVQQYIDDASDCTFHRQQRELVSDHSYVRVVGQVKEYDNRKNVVGFGVRTLSSGNELTHHMLEVVYSAERYKKNNSNSNSTAMNLHSAMNMAAGPYGTNPSISSPLQPNRNNNFSLQSAGGQQGGGTSSSSEQGLHDAVLRFIQAQGDNSDVGADLNECIQTLAGTFTDADVRRSIDHLSSEGHIYSTVNETKFKYAM